MFESGGILYVLLAALLYMFRRHTRGCSLEDLLERSERDHHAVHAVLARHPRGGSWPQFRRWLREEREQHPCAP